MVELGDGQPRGVGERTVLFFILVQAEAAQHALDARAPVVEVARHHQRRAHWHFALDEALQLVDLAHAAARHQPQVDHDDVHRAALEHHLDVQQATLFEAVV